MSGIMQLLLSGRPQVASDPYFEYTTLLLPGNGTNGAQNNTFLDSSTNNFTITRNGNTTQGTFSPFSQTGWGNFFDGSGDYLSLADNAAFQYGTGDFTIEFWFYMSATAGSGNYYVLYDGRPSGTTGAYVNIAINNATPESYVSGSTVITGSALSANTWYHFAYARSGTSTKMFVNGTQVGSTYTDTTNYVNGTSRPVIGTNGFTVGTSNFNGYLSNYRVVKGTAVYTANFTPSTTPLTAITNTSLLTCQSNRFIDNSTNNFTITRNGDVSVQAFSPFNPTASWSAATYGGSGYFDGSGDYLGTPSDAAFTFGTGDFTIEFWIRTSSTGFNIMNPASATGAGYWGLLVQSSNLRWNDQYNVNNLWQISASAILDGAWHHVAIARASGSTKVFYDGVLQTTQSDTTNYNGTTAWHIGSGNVAAYSGYFSGFRIVKGTAVYTTAFTPPTAPPTAITNTSLLLNFTNAGIYDATSKNDLETVGNAQISTTQSKFGGSSMSFDGSGDRAVLPFFPWLQMGSGDWTIEMWLYINAAPGGGLYFNLYANRASTGNFSPIAIFVNSARNIEAYFSTSGSGWTSSLTTAGTISTSTWTHVAVVRNGSTVKVYFNGTADATTTTISGALFANTSPLFVGGEAGGNDLNGYINDYRVTKGYARYTTNFTAPTAAFPLL